MFAFVLFVKVVVPIQFAHESPVPCSLHAKLAKPTRVYHFVSSMDAREYLGAQVSPFGRVRK